MTAIATIIGRTFGALLEMRVLVIEDHADVAETIGEYLSSRGHAVETAADGVRGLEMAREGSHDVVVLDRLLPGIDGGTVCSRLRFEGVKSPPVLMLTALTTLEDKLAGFAAGADDYLTKPFDLAELEARLVALHRRVAQSGITSARLQIDDLVYDSSTLQAARGGATLELTPTGRRILEHLMRCSHRVVPRSELEEALWGKGSGNEELLRVHIHALRNAVDSARRRRLLHTVRGSGYRLAIMDED